MFKKITFIFIVLAVIFLCISSVSANDNVTSDFDDLGLQINQTQPGHTITLDKDYQTANSSMDYILIDKSITIDGAGHTIDASGVKRAFWVKADNVCIKNINFINAKKTGLAGGAVSWWGNNGTLENCSFTNNSAISAGGALLWRGDDGNIANCNFLNNSVGYGAAVSLTDGDGFDPSQPHIQIVNSEGGALYISGNNISVRLCDFSDNIALLNGGALSINWGSNVTVSSSRFKNNKACYNGGAIDWNSPDATIINSTFENNSPKNLFLNAETTIVNSTFDKKQSIESWGNVSYVNVEFADMGSFDDLSIKVNKTPEGGVLVLDKDYEYINGTNKGALISKSITIDGAGHTLNGNKLSRMFNVTSDNVTIKNINFINGNAFGRYYGIAGGGAIYWYGSNGLVEMCNFTDNAGRGIEDDPFEKEEIIVLDDGTVIYQYRERPMGAKINEGGAIVWNGTNGVVSKCIFMNNHVGYPNSGGAICWRGDNGTILNSEFYKSDAWCGSAICWFGNNGTILSSIIANSSFFDGGIYWFGKNGNIHNSVLLNMAYGNSLNPFNCNVNADYNFWGDTLENPNGTIKIKNISNWLVIKFSHNGEFVKKGQKLVIKSDITTLIDKNGYMSSYYGLINYSSQIKYTADKTGFLNITYIKGKINIAIDSGDAIKSSDLTRYYVSKTTYSVKVFNYLGKVVGKKVKFTIGNKNYYSVTDKNGVAALKINLKPGTHTVYSSYGKAKVKNQITIKTTLITKNVIKKVKKSAKFAVKVLNSKGKPYGDKLVKINFKGKNYKIKTNSNGIAAFSIPKNLKVGSHTIKTSYGGLTNSNLIIVH